MILSSNGDECYVETTDDVPKIIENCSLGVGDKTMIKLGKVLRGQQLLTPDR